MSISVQNYTHKMGYPTLTWDIGMAQPDLNYLSNPKSSTQSTRIRIVRFRPGWVFNQFKLINLLFKKKDKKVKLKSYGAVHMPSKSIKNKNSSFVVIWSPNGFIRLTFV